MKLISYKYNGQLEAGILSKDEKQVFSLVSMGLVYTDMNQFIARTTKEELGRIQGFIDERALCGIPLEDIELLAPIPKPDHDIICLGNNYLEHAQEFSRYKKEEYHSNQYPVYFSKRVNEAVPHKGVISSHNDILEGLDYEVELAVIIGKRAYKVKKEEAFEYVFGYTILNDVSGREIQTRHKQWYLGKSLDGFCPMGPCIVTRDEFAQPPVLKIMSRVNGEIRQSSTTDLLIFSIAHVIEELSKGMTLEAGTIISMGTPAGVGMGLEPPCFLKPGDIIECEIEGIGKLTNEVV